MGALIGSAIGAIGALVLTPLSGEKLRNRIGSFLNGSKGKRGSHLEDILKVVSPKKAVKRATKAVTEKKPSVKRKAPAKSKKTTHHATSNH